MCFVHGQDQKREQKHTTKKFIEFHNHCLLSCCTQSCRTDLVSSIFQSWFFGVSEVSFLSILLGNLNEIVFLYFLSVVNR